MLFRKKRQDPKPLLVSFEEIPDELAAHRIPFKIGDAVVSSAKDYLAQCAEKIEALQKQKESSEKLVRLNTLYVDDLVRTLFERADWLFQETSPNASRQCTLLALGGYGRREMSLCSDVDLMFVYSEKPEEYLTCLTDAILYVLWDCGLEVGSAVRSLKDCRKIMAEDIVSLTSMLDARFLAGDPKVAGDFFKLMQEQIGISSILQNFIEGKILEVEDRKKRYGGSIFILEPQIKEGEGGLRDLQTLFWLGKVLLKIQQWNDLVSHKILSSEALDEMIRGRDFLWNVRTALHLKTRKKQDQLTFELQEWVSSAFGFEDEVGILGVEKFMQAYYQHTASIKRITGLAIEQLLANSLLHSKKRLNKNAPYDAHFSIREGKIHLNDSEIFKKDPIQMVKVFWIAQEQEADLAQETRHLLSENLDRLSPRLIETEAVREIIRKCFGELRGLGRVLHLMHEMRLLDRIIAEFAEVLYRPQHDAYHIYTVDTHSIMAVSELSKLKEGTYDQEFPVFKEVLQQISRHDLLSLGVFFHDIGKGRGKNHAVVGAEMAVRATERLGYSEKEQEVVEFLVKSHLLMPHLSQRRDLDDMNLIIQFAKSMQHLDHLNMLFLLTWADIRAVGPDVWTPWKGTLLAELYRRTRRILESGNYTKEKVDLWVDESRRKVLALSEKQVSPDRMDEYLKNMPVKYYFNYTPEEISTHLKAISQTGFDSILIHLSVLEQEKLSELMVHVTSTPGLLAKVAGVMAVHDFNILEAKQYVSKSGSALITVRFVDAKGEMVYEERRFENFKEDLLKILGGKMRVSSLIEARKKPAWSQKKPARTMPTRIEVDNDVSAYYTVLDIYTHDRVGLLYEILTALSVLGLYVDVSKISTKVDQVADVFYVKDIFGQKVTQVEKLKRVQGELIRVIDGE